MKRFSVGIYWLVLFFSIAIVYSSVAADKIPRDQLYTSDTLFIPAFYQDIFSSYSLLGWKMQPAPAFFPDMLLYFILNALTGNFHVAMSLYGVAQSLLFVIAVIYLGNSLFGSDPFFHSVFLLMGIIFFLLLATGNITACLPILQSGHHFGATLMAMFSLGFIGQTLKHNSDKRRVLVYSGLLGGLAILTLISDMIYLVQFLLPALICLFIFFGLSIITRRTLLWLTGALLVPIPVGYLADRFLLRPWKPPVVYSGSLRENAVKTVEDISLWMEQVWCSHQFLPFLQVIWGLFLVTTIVFLGILLKKSITNRQNRIRYTGALFLMSFFFFSILTTIMAALATGVSHSRYFLPALFIPLFWGWPFLIALIHDLGVTAVAKYTRYVLIAGAFLLFISPGTVSAVKKLPAITQLSDYYPDFVKCLDLETQARNLQYGLAEYWDAKYVSMLSKHGLHVVQVLQNQEEKLLVIYEWINNVNWYKHDFEFLIISGVQVDKLSIIDKQLVMEFFGAPADTFFCGGKEVFVYNTDQHKTFQTQFKKLLFFEFLAGDLPSETGELVGTSRIANENSEKGYLTYGPYSWLWVGDYRFTIHYEAQNNVKGKWGILLRPPDKDSKRLKKGNFDREGVHMISGVFHVRRGGLIEIRTHYGGEGSLQVDKITIERIR